ncbi:MAG: purine/pyrimidine permease [Deltaproteobacteria bacterium]|jgi:uracil-xanthine permease|nr:purine/pyrimidine permease [Deltaproteobacteria bacterium]
MAEEKRWIIYTIDDKPPIGESIFLGIQHYLTMFGATVLIPILLAGAMKMPPGETALLISTIFLCSGITTWLQSTIGNKLPVIQGGSFSFLPPAFVIIGATVGKGMGFEIAIQQITGAIIVASFFEIILGWSGIMGKVKKYVGPITIGPTIALIGLALYKVGAPVAFAEGKGGSWLVAGLTIIALIVYSQLLGKKSRIFLLFPVLLAIITGWAIATIISLLGIVEAGHPAYVDWGKVAAAPWVSIKPILPFKWGFPQFKIALILAMVAAYVASMIESIGDYYAAARMSEAPTPDAAMISRGLGTEGIGCFIAGLLQTCNGSTTYSENIGAIGLTRVASRYVVRWGASIMIVLAFITKFGAIFTTLPGPVVGAMYCGLFGMIAAVGLSNLVLCDMTSSRNLFIIGFAFFMGLSLPEYFDKFPLGADWPVSTKWLGDIVTTLGKTGMAVAAIIGLVLDNILP